VTNLHCNILYIQMNQTEKPLISIVMAYFNRINQIQSALTSISKSSYKKFEVIIVDDASNEMHNLKNLINNYDFPIKLLIIKEEQKTWKNPCVPYNLGFKMARGEFIIIQNPEIYHVGDVLSYVSKNLQEGTYLSFSVYNSPSPTHNNELTKLDSLNNYAIINEFINKIRYEDFDFDYDFYINSYDDIKNLNIVEAMNHWNNIGIKERRLCNKNHIFHPKAYIQWKGWYNHPVHNNRPYHFLSAITRKDLNKIGGFDPIFKNGIWYDDDDFLSRVSKVSNVKNIDTNDVFGVHLYHEMGSADQMNQPNFKTLRAINKKLRRANIKHNIIVADVGDPEEYKNYELIENKIEK